MRKLKPEDKIFLFLFVIIILGGFLKPLISPTSNNTIENRFSYKIPVFDIDSFKSKKYQNDMEKAFSDQIPLVDKMKLFTKTNIIASKKAFYQLLDNNNYYNLSNDIYLFNDILVYTKITSDLSSSLDMRISNINKYANSIPDVKFSAYYIERDVDIDFRDNSKIGAYEYLFKGLNKTINFKRFEINNLDEFKHYFYKTDHHWNHIGSYKAYQEIIPMITSEQKIPYQEELCFSNAMSGSKAIFVGGTNVFKEDFCAYRFELKEHDTYVNYQKTDSYGKSATIIKNGSKNISYGGFYGLDYGLVEFDYHQEEKENLLIIGESYDNAISELIASHFNKTFNIDLRYYKNAIGKDFDLYKFVSENDIDQILLIGNLGYFIKDEYNLRGEE